ncbi:MAG: hypothetical protein J6W75_06990 [Bacteroidaceae bacterium]|nr:hypothetical protein [Bacteroidaceae bacterium]
MKNIFFPDETISPNDLRFVCYMIERTARKLKQPNSYVVNKMGKRELTERLSVANVQHAENPEAVVQQWTEDHHLETGTFDVLAVNPDYVTTPPTALQMGKVYARLIEQTQSSDEDYADAILRVYNSPICQILDDYNSSAYYEPSYYIARAYYQGSFN